MDKGKNWNKITCIIDSNSFPIYSTVDTGNTHDAKIIKTVIQDLEQLKRIENDVNIIGDKGYINNITKIKRKKE